jgi:hypothetical protein
MFAHDHASSSRPTFFSSIWSSDEYLVLALSAP